MESSCADCGASGPEWASINRGILVCSDCCSVHRSLGRHVSQIKNIHDKDWHPHTWNLVSTLSSGSANSVWEHTLLDPTNKTAKKKPTSSDPVHPVKADFIRAKHQMLAFVIQPRALSSPAPNTAHGGGGVTVGCAGLDDGDKNGEEEAGVGDEDEEEASQELHSSVRTANLATSLRLLSQGADPNYYHKTRGNYPLHVAATLGQAAQCELLLVYGALPHCLDDAGHTPAQCASTAGYPHLSARLTAVQYELVQRIVCFLSNQHRGALPHSSSTLLSTFPQDASTDTDSVLVDGDVSNTTTTSLLFMPPHLLNAHQHGTEIARQARARLVQMPGVLLEELAADLYDEVDRRELEEQCGVGCGASERCTVPFLPVNPLLSSTRNQARQKLARLKQSELCSLMVDLLVEARRRAAVVAPSSASASADAAVAASDDDPLYDTVCSEDDYSLVEQLKMQHAHGTCLEEKDYQEVVESVDEQPMSQLSTVTAADNGTPTNINDVSMSCSDCAKSSENNAFHTANTNHAHDVNHSRDVAAVGAAPAAAAESQLVRVPLALSSSQKRLVTKTFTPPTLSPTLSTITQLQQQSGRSIAMHDGGVTADHYELMRQKLEESERTIRELQADNQYMKTHLEQLSSTVPRLREHQASVMVHPGQQVHKLRRENSSLRSLASPSPPPTLLSSSPTHGYHLNTPYQSLPPLHNGNTSPAFNTHSSVSRSFSSMPYQHQRSDSYPSYSEPSNGGQYYPSPPPVPPPLVPSPLVPSPQYGYPTRPSCTALLSRNTSSSNNAGSSANHQQQQQQYANTTSMNITGSVGSVQPARPYSMFERSDRYMGRSGSNSESADTYESICSSAEWDAQRSSAVRRGQHRRSCSLSEDLSVEEAGNYPPHTLPSQAQVVGLTDSITRGIQDLLIVAQGGGSGDPQQFVACSDRITLAVKQMAAAFPRGSTYGSPSPMPSSMHGALVTLVKSTVSLSTLCDAGSNAQTLIQPAFAIAQATKNLVTCFQ